MKTLRMAIILATVRIAAAQNMVTDVGSISGFVQEAVTGKLLEGAKVNGASQEVVTDVHGHFQIRELKPGSYHLIAYSGMNPSSTKSVALGAGQDLGPIVLTMPALGSITGRVVDENKLPLAGTDVLLVGSTYSLGQLRHVFLRSTSTDDKGVYLFTQIRPGSGYMLMARKRRPRIEALSDAPEDIKFRKKIAGDSFYPGSPNIEGAQPLLVHEAEHLEGMDIVMRKSPSYCINGVLQASGRVKALEFFIEGTAATWGSYGDGGAFAMGAGGTSGADGKIRICDFVPGEYKMTTVDLPSNQNLGLLAFGTTLITITDRDVRDVHIAGNPRIAVPGHVEWDGKAPDPPISAKITLWLEPLTRAFYAEEMNSFSASAAVPGDFSFPGLSFDEYKIHFQGLTGDDLYLKDVTYAGVSILHLPLSVGKAIGTPDLRVVISHDGGHIQASVKDRDGNAIPDSYIFCVPIEVTSETLLPDAMTAGQADQNAKYTSRALRPGKYAVFAQLQPADPSLDTIEKLWQARSRAQEIEVSANATAAITLTVK